MNMLMKGLFSLVLFVFVDSKTNDQARSIKSDKLNITEECQRKISLGVYECIQGKLILREKNTDDYHGNLEKMVACCSQWDMVDCALQNVQVLY